MPDTRLPACVPQISDTGAFAGNPLPLSTARVCTGPCAGVMLRPAPATLDVSRGHFCGWYGSTYPPAATAPGRDAKHEPRPRQVRVWRLLVIQIALAHVAGVDLDLVIAHGTGGAEPRDGRAARVGGRHVADFLIVPIHHPRALHRPPSETGDAKLDERADWSFGWMHLEGLRHFDAALRQRLARIGDGDGVHAAEVFRNGEMGRESPVGVDLRSSQDLRAVGEPLPSKAVTILDDPAAVDGLPHQIDRPVRRQTFGGRVDLGADHRLGGFRVRERQGLQPGGRRFFRVD